MTGDILVDGEGLSPAFARKIGFCEQADVHEVRKYSAAASGS